jgi:hypothetical protein
MTTEQTSQPNKQPLTFEGFNVNVPPKHPFPRKYWFMGPLEREITWLLDQNRIDDAVVYFINDCGASFPHEMQFLQSRPNPGGRVARLLTEGRVRLFRETLQRRHRRWGTDELVLGSNSGIERILADVAFLSEPRNPEYVRLMSWPAADATIERGTDAAG